MDWSYGEAVEQVFTPEELRKRLFAEARRVGSEAAELGTVIHNAFDNFVRTGACDPKYFKLCSDVLDYIVNNFGDIVSTEQSFCNTKYGYGGCIDVVAEKEGIRYVIDLKTKDFTDDKKVKSFIYDNHSMQLAAYTEAVRPKYTDTKYIAANVFISTNEKHFGLIKHYTFSDDELRRGRDMFLELLSYWRLAKKYYPGDEV